MLNKNMKQVLYSRRSAVTLTFVLFFFLTIGFGCCQTPVAPLAPAPASNGAVAPSTGLSSLTPMMREKAIAAAFVRQLESRHISQRKLDANISKEAFRLYLKTLDPLKMYFYQSDIDEFTAKYETQICDMAKNRNLDAAFDIYNRFLARVKERVDMIQAILGTPLDFTVDEEVARDKEMMHWAKTENEAYDRWRKRIKDEMLSLRADARERAKSKEKAIAEGKEPPKTNPNDERDPVERLQKRYISFRKRMLMENHLEAGEALEVVKRNALDDVLEKYLSAIAGALDPHSSYMSVTTLKTFEIMMRKQLEGIGATLTSEDGYTVVKKLSKGGPAQKSGQLKENDKITGVGQGKGGKIEDVVDMSLTDVVQLVRGTKGTLVRLEILPADGSAVRIIEIIRDKIALEDQVAKKEVFEFGQKPDGTPYKIGVIDVPDFYLDADAMRLNDPEARSTTTDVRKMLQSFVQENIDLVVLDLKMNGGGSLQEAVSLTGLFFESGNIVQTKDEVGGRPVQLNDDDPSCDWTGPLVVVVSKFSASASEIFAGAIKDYKRGLIIGDSKTHGKGTVQQLTDLNAPLYHSLGDSMGAIKLTIRGFYRPSGVSPQREGIVSDVVIPSLTDVLEDIHESDLPNALTLNRTSVAPNFPKLPAYVNDALSKSLQQKSDERITTSEEFTRDKKDIEAYKELKARKTSPLNEQKYFAEIDRLNANKREKDKLEELLDDSDTITRDHYLDEVMAIAIDYIRSLEQQSTAFPKERTVNARPTRGGILNLFGR